MEEFILASIFWITFHFTSSVCLCMKTCTQISDSGFVGINVVSPCDSAKRASPPRRADFSHVNAR